MTLVCYNKPNRTKRRTYTARDCGRIVAYARNAGESDTEILAQVAKAYGIKEYACLLHQILDVLNRGVLLGAMVTVLTALATLLKGIKILATGKKGLITSFLQAVLPKRLWRQLGVLLVGIGALQALSGVAVIFLSAMVNNAQLYLILQGVCNTSTPDFHVNTDDLDMGNARNDLRSILDELESVSIDEEEEEKQDRGGRRNR